MTVERHPIGVGLAGLGLGAALTVPWIASDPRFRIVAAADPRAEARDAFTSAIDGRVYADLEELCRDPDVELVYISTPHFMHEEHALLAIDAGRHVLVEKPLSRTVRQAETIVDAARRAGVLALYGHTHAFDPPVRRMAELVRSGEFGRLGMIVTMNYNDLVYRPRAGWELDPVVSGGSPFIQAPHQIDVARWIAGSEIRHAMGWSAALDETRSIAGTHLGMLEFENGAAASLAYSGYAHFDSARWIGWLGESGERRSGSAHRDTMRSFLARRERSEAEDDARNARRIGVQSLRLDPGVRRSETFGVTIVSCAGGDIRQVPSGLIIEEGARTRHIRVPPDSGRAVMLGEVHAAIRLDASPTIDAAWAVETVRISHMLERSTRMAPEAESDG